MSPNAHLLERIRVLGGYIRAGLHAPMNPGRRALRGPGHAHRGRVRRDTAVDGAVHPGLARPEAVIRVKRSAVKLHQCGSNRAKDANVRQALIDKMGPPGTKKAPGPTMA